MRDLDVEQVRMQATNPIFQLVQKLQCPAGVDVDRGHSAPTRNFDQSAAKDNPISLKWPAPKIRQVGGVAGLAASQAERRQFLVRERTGGKRHRQLRFRTIGELREFERFGIRRKDYLTGSHHPFADMKNYRLGEFNTLDRAVFVYEDAAVSCRPCQTGDQFARVQRPAGYFFSDSQLAGIGPANRRGGVFTGSIEFVNAGKVQVTRDLQLPENRRYPAQDVAKSRQISRCSFGQRKSASVSAGACADRFRLEDRDASGRVKTFAIGGRRETAKATANNGDVDVTWDGRLLGNEVYRPRRLSPSNWVRRGRQLGCLSSGWPSKDACAGRRGTGKEPLSAWLAGSDSERRMDFTHRWRL